MPRLVSVLANVVERRSTHGRTVQKLGIRSGSRAHRWPRPITDDGGSSRRRRRLVFGSTPTAWRAERQPLSGVLGFRRSLYRGAAQRDRCGRIADGSLERLEVRSPLSAGEQARLRQPQHERGMRYEEEDQFERCRFGDEGGPQVDNSRAREERREEG